MPERATAAEWLVAVRDQERRGELLSAFDLAERGLTEHPADLGLKHRAVLALARTGATHEAARRFAEYRLDDVPDEDVSALRARLAKDFALGASGGERTRLAAAAAEDYEAIFTRTGGYYPAINAATLWLLAGFAARSCALAKTVLWQLDSESTESYYKAATQAEAHLILGDPSAAAIALARAAELLQGDWGAAATTRRQLRIVCEALD